jgi:hypothetical protein
MKTAVRRIEDTLRRDGCSCQEYRDTLRRDGNSYQEDREYLEKRWMQLSGG